MENYEINLNELVNKVPSELPEFVNFKNLVYCCKNLINGKVYVGETKRTLRERWMEHKYILTERTSRNIQMAIHSAIKKYGMDSFSISILETDLPNDEERWERERYWIDRLNSFIDSPNSNGYNMTIGGHESTKLSKIYSARRIKTCLEKYGQHPMLSEESRKKALETNRKNHGGILAFQAEEYRQKGMETQKRKYGMLAIHLPENKEKARIAKEKLKEKNGGVLPYNTKEAIAKAQKSAPLYRMIGCIIRHISILKKRGLEINARNYVLETYDAKHMWQQHVPHVLRKIDELRKIHKWTDEMEKIFSNISYDENEHGIKKIIFKDEY